MEPESESVFSTPKSRPATEASINTSIEELLAMEESDVPRAHDSDDDFTASSSSPIVSPVSVTSPPYWLNHSQETYSTGEGGTESGGITMMDNEVNDEDGNNPRSSACWARAVEIPDYVVVNGSATNIGAFVVFTVRVQTMNVSFTRIYPLPTLSFHLARFPAVVLGSCWRENNPPQRWPRRRIHFQGLDN